jgi:hypothetical protein
MTKLKLQSADEFRVSKDAIRRILGSARVRYPEQNGQLKRLPYN